MTLVVNWNEMRHEHATAVNLFLGQERFVELLRIIPDEFYSWSDRKQTEAWLRMRRAIRFGITSPYMLSKLVHITSLTPEMLA